MIMNGHGHKLKSSVGHKRKLEIEERLITNQNSISRSTSTSRGLYPSSQIGNVSILMLLSFLFYIACARPWIGICSGFGSSVCWYSLSDEIRTPKSVPERRWKRRARICQRIARSSQGAWWWWRSIHTAATSEDWIRVPNSPLVRVKPKSFTRSN